MNISNNRGIVYLWVIILTVIITLIVTASVFLIYQKIDIQSIKKPEAQNFENLKEVKSKSCQITMYFPSNTRVEVVEPGGDKMKRECSFTAFNEGEQIPFFFLTNMRFTDNAWEYYMNSGAEKLDLLGGQAVFLNGSKFSGVRDDIEAYTIFFSKGKNVYSSEYYVTAGNKFVKEDFIKLLNSIKFTGDDSFYESVDPSFLQVAREGFIKSMNTVRKVDAIYLKDLILKYAGNHGGNFPPGTPSIGKSASISSSGTGSMFCKALVPALIPQLPHDPDDEFYFENCDDYDSGYLISVLADNTISVQAPSAEGETIIVTQNPK